MASMVASSSWCSSIRSASLWVGKQQRPQGHWYHGSYLKMLQLNYFFFTPEHNRFLAPTPAVKQWSDADLAAGMCIVVPSHCPRAHTLDINKEQLIQTFKLAIKMFQLTNCQINQMMVPRSMTCCWAPVITKTFKVLELDLGMYTNR